MNVNDLSKFSLGQYGSVSLDSAEQLSLLGSNKYLIGAIQILSNRENTAADNSFKYLNADSSSPNFWGTSYGGNMVLQFNGAEVNSSARTIKINNSVDWQHIRVGNSCNYWKRGQTDSTFGLTSTTVDSSTTPQSATTYYVISKNEQNKTIQLATSVGGTAIGITTQTDSSRPLRALTFPALIAQSENLISEALDADVANQDADQFTDGDNIVEGAVLYGRWNFVRMGSFVRAIAYLIPKII